MKIHFKSTYGPNDNKNVIEFYAKLEKTIQDDFTVLDFEQKVNSKKTIKNRIEYNEDKVFIYSGVSTLALEKGIVVKNLFKVDGGPVDIYIYTHLDNVEILNDGVNLFYKVGSNEEMEEANTFELNLKFLEE